jgi:signal recognition particle receptor subunit beta
MAVFDRQQEKLVARVVYDGPAGAGKTTNLNQLCRFFTMLRRSELVTPAEAAGRTLFFDWLQLDGGLVGGVPLRCHLLTVPGQAVLAHRRLHLLAGADVIVFVCDSTSSGVDMGRRMLDGLRGRLPDSATLPLVVQANKQDEPDCLTPGQVLEGLGLPGNVPVVPARAHEGQGLRETLVLAIRAAANVIQAHILAHGLHSLEGQVGSWDDLYQELQAHDATQRGDQSAASTVWANLGVPTGLPHPHPATAPRDTDVASGSEPPPAPTSVAAAPAPGSLPATPYAAAVTAGATETMPQVTGARSTLPAARELPTPESPTSAPGADVEATTRAQLVTATSSEASTPMSTTAFPSPASSPSAPPACEPVATGAASAMELPTPPVASAAPAIQPLVASTTRPASASSPAEMHAHQAAVAPTPAAHVAPAASEARSDTGTSTAAAIDAATSTSPSTPGTPMVGNALPATVAAKTSPPQGRVAAQADAEPTLPHVDVAIGFVWPANPGRDILRAIPRQQALRHDDLVGRHGRSDGSGTSDARIYRAGDWCLKTSTRRRFADVDDARQAMLQLARRKIALGELLPPRTVLCLTPALDGSVWLWTITPWLTTLRNWMERSEQLEDEATLELALCAFADAAVQALQVASQQRLTLDVHPSNFALAEGRLVYLDDDIGTGTRLPTLGHALLRRADEYAQWPRAVAGYVTGLEQGLGMAAPDLDEATRRDLAAGLASALAVSPAATQARTRLLAVLGQGR